ncbi:MAG: tetratricopeptide repeat protein [Terracidiphilus sp.]
MSVGRPPADASAVQRLLSGAIDAHKAGRLDEAKQLYLQVLAIDVRHAKSLYGLGLIAHQAGSLDAAARMMQRAIEVSPREAAYRRSLGAVLKEQRRLDEALAVYGTVLAIEPADEESHYNLAEILREQGKLQDAERHYRRALELNPQCGATHQNLGIVLRRLGQLEAAAASFARALELDPDDVAALHNVGNLLLNGGKAEGARAAFERVIQLAPELAEARNGLGAALQDLGDLDGAEASYREALRLKPELAEAHCNLGNLAKRRGQLAEANKHYERAVGLNPGLVEARSNLGLIAQNQSKLAEARAHFDQAIAIDAGSADARWNLCLLDLLEGKLETGWKDYEIRYARPQSAPRRFPGPLWRGEALDGARILLHSEQGLGDTLQFLRYVPLVQVAGGQVILDVQPPVRRLVEGLAGVTLRSEGDTMPEYAWQCPLMGLPLAFGTTLATIPHEAPYLTVPRAALEAADKLEWPAEALRVGLVWSGNPEHKEDRYRSVSLRMLEPVLNVDGARFFSLQLGAPAAQLGEMGSTITDLRGAIKDFADTAALVANLDLVITVDTAVAHLAGALAKPVWVLLPFAPDWRWLTERADCPWYPTMHLFRPPAILAWEPVIEGVRSGLDAMVKRKQMG